MTRLAVGSETARLERSQRCERHCPTSCAIAGNDIEVDRDIDLLGQTRPNSDSLRPFSTKDRVAIGVEFGHISFNVGRPRLAFP